MGKASVLFEVIVGTYEEFLLGYQFFIEGENNECKLSQLFATHSHRASVRSVACRNKLVVSGGADETINIYNMLHRKECGMLMEHNGTITSLSFTPDCSHLISTSEDGSIKIFRQGSWQLEKEFPTAHKGTAVTCLAVHPSGKMALSVGKDHTLRTWNLVKGRPAYATNLYSRCRQLEYVVWSPGGTMFAVPMEMKLEISSMDKGGVLHTLQFPSKVATCVFLSDEVLCVGEASGVVSGHCTESGDQLWSLPGEQRVRGLAYMHSHLVSATSAGILRVYSASDVTTLPQEVARADAGCRITCLTLYDYKTEVKVKIEKADDVKLHQDKNVSSKKQKHSEDDDGDKSEKKDLLQISTKLKKNKRPTDNLKETTFSIEQTPTKKQKLTNRKVLCLPRSQTWIVENSNR